MISHVHEPLTHAGGWRQLYARPQQPFILELGCCKGGFISQLACAHPENNYLGHRHHRQGADYVAKRKIEAAYAAAGRPVDNVTIDEHRHRAHPGRDSAPEDTVQRLYINFCNPWSKNASSNKHRLTYPRQLFQYRRAFWPTAARIYFKTDDDDLFRDSLEYFPASGYKILSDHLRGLHKDEPAWNIRTEHEGMFTEMGIPIKALIARKKPGADTVTWVEPKVLQADGSGGCRPAGRRGERKWLIPALCA